MRRCFVLAALALSGPALADDVGLRVLVQPWTPWADDDLAYPVVDDPTLISGGLHDGWTQNTQALHDELVGLLGTGDLFAEGVTLYDIDLNIPEPSLSVVSLGGGAGASSLDLVWTVTFEHVHLAATSTTPDVTGDIGFGSYADPRASIDFDLTVTVPVGVGTDPAAPFTTTVTADSQIVQITNVDVDSGSWLTDILLAGANMLGFDVDTLVEQGIAGPIRGVNAAVVGMVQEALSDANSAVGSVVPSGMARLSAWAWPGQPLTLAFGVVGPFPDGPAGAISGTFRSSSVDGILTSATACAAIPVAASRKTGPRPIVDPWGGLGDEPLEPLYADFQCGEPDENGVSTFVLTGLSAGFPNRISVGSDSGCTVSDPSSIRSVFHVDGMPDRLLPQDFATTYDLTGDAYLEPCGAQTPEVQTWFEEHVDPVINPADSVWSVFDDGAWTRFTVDSSVPTVYTSTISALSAPVIELQGPALTR